MFVKMLPRLHQTHLILVATLFLGLTCSFSVWAGHHTVIMVTAQAQPGTTEAEREKEPRTATKKTDPKKETITPVTPTQKNQPPSDKKRATTEVENGQETPTTTKKAGSQKETIGPVKPTQKGQPPTAKKKAGARRTAPIDHSTTLPGQIIVKGHVRTAQGRPLADAIVTRGSPKPTPRDFLTGADPGWDARKDAQPPPFDTSDDDGSFAVRLQGELGMLPVSDAPVEDMIVTLNTRERYIALLKPGITPTDFVNDYGLQDVKIISAPSTGGSLVTYSVPSDQNKVKDLQDAISKDKRVAFTELNHCREIQPNGRSEAYPVADGTTVAAKDCETIAVKEEPIPFGVGCGTMTVPRPAQLIPRPEGNEVQKVKEDYERLLTYIRSVMEELAVGEKQLNDLIADASTLTREQFEKKHGAEGGKTPSGRTRFEIAKDALFKILAWQAAFRELWEEAQKALIQKHSDDPTRKRIRDTSSGVSRLEGELAALLKEQERAVKKFEDDLAALHKKTLRIMEQWDEIMLSGGGADCAGLVALAAFLAKWRNWETYVEGSEELVLELQKAVPGLKDKMADLEAARGLQTTLYNKAVKEQNLLPKLAKEGLPQYRPEERFGKLLEEDKQKAPMSVNEFIDKMNSLNRARMTHEAQR